jgi:hypothetical protein
VPQHRVQARPKHVANRGAWLIGEGEVLDERHVDEVGDSRLRGVEKAVQKVEKLLQLQTVVVDEPLGPSLVVAHDHVR